MHDSRPTSVLYLPRYMQRRHLWIRGEEPLVCPNGHKIKHNSALLQQGALICQHKEPHQSGECGSRVYVLQMPYGLKFVAEVTVKEMLTMRDRCMTVDEVLAFLQGKSA